MESEKTPQTGMETAAAENTVTNAEPNAAAAPVSKEDARKMVYRETRIIAVGEVIASALMIAVFALLGKYDVSVLLGSVIGAVLTVANFFFMAISASLAADKAQSQDVKGGTALMKGSYAVRMLVIFVVLFACIKSGLCNVIACALPLVFVRPIITIAEFFRK